MPKIEYTTYWATLVVGVPATVVGAVFTTLQFLTREGQSLPSGLAVSPGLYAWLGQGLLYLAVLVGLVRLVAISRTSRNDPSERDKAYRAWLEERGREISERCVAEHRALEKRLEALVVTIMRPSAPTYDATMSPLRPRRPPNRSPYPDFNVFTVVRPDGRIVKYHRMDVQGLGEHERQLLFLDYIGMNQWYDWPWPRK